VLEEIKNYLTCGHVKNNDAAGKRDKTMVYVVRDRQDLLRKIIPFFEQSPLRTEKRNDFKVFKSIVLMLERNQHQDLEGFKEIVELAYSMNAGGRYRKRDKEAILESLTSSETIRWIPERCSGKDIVRSSWRHEDSQRNLWALVQK